MKIYSIDDWFSDDEDKELARKLIKNLIEKEPENHYDECMASFLEEFCDEVNKMKITNNQIPVSCIVLSEIKEKIKEKQKTLKNIVKTNKED